MLPEVSLEELDGFDSRTLLASLEGPGSRVALRWTQDGQQRAFVTARSQAHALTNLFGGWAVHTDLSCDPEAAVNIHLGMPSDGPRPLTPGGYAFSALGFDVPSLEQGTDEATVVTDGTVEVESVDGLVITGMLSGYGQVVVKSHFDQQPVGVTVEVVGMAFREVRLDSDYD